MKCQAEEAITKRGYDSGTPLECELEAGHDGWHRYEDRDVRLEWKPRGTADGAVTQFVAGDFTADADSPSMFHRDAVVVMITEGQSRGLPSPPA